MICAFVAEHRARFGVAPICRVLTEHGCPIAPRTFYAWARRAPSKRALWDTVITQILAGYYEPDEHGRRAPESLYGSVKMWAQLNRQNITVAKCTVERLMKANGWEGVRRVKRVRTTVENRGLADHLGGHRDQVWAINPIQTARYRDRHSSSGAKSDPGDAHVLAEIVRLDRAHHRPLAGDSAIAEHVKVAARAHQTMIWTRQRNTNVTRSILREYYPAALVAFDDLASRDALAVLAAAPGPEQGRKLTVARVEVLLRRAGRQRYVTKRATEIVAALRSEQLPARPGVVDAYAGAVAALVSGRDQRLHPRPAVGLDAYQHLARVVVIAEMIADQTVQLGDPSHSFRQAAPRQHPAVCVFQLNVVMGLSPVVPEKQHPSGPFHSTVNSASSV